MLDQAADTPPYSPFFACEADGLAWARALIGEDVQKGLHEVSRLKAIARAAYEEEARIVDECKAATEGRPTDERYAALENWPGTREAETAADEAGEHHHHATFYVLKMPIRSVADAVAKARFAIENADYADAEDFKGDVLQQIAEFLQPRQFLQAAE